MTKDLKNGTENLMKIFPTFLLTCFPFFLPESIQKCVKYKKGEEYFIKLHAQMI